MGLVWLWLDGKRSRDYLPAFATLNAPSTSHGARPGPKLAPSVPGGPPACPAAESARKDSRSEQKRYPMCEKKLIWYIHV